PQGPVRPQGDEPVGRRRALSGADRRGPPERSAPQPESKAVGRGALYARGPLAGEPLSDAPLLPQAGGRSRGGPERPAPVLPERRVPRIPAAGEDAGARGPDLHQRSEAGEAVQAVPRP